MLSTPSNQLFHKRGTALSHTTSFWTQPAPLHDKANRIFKHNDQFKSAIMAAQHQGDGFVATAQGTIRENTRIEPV